MSNYFKDKVKEKLGIDISNQKEYQQQNQKQQPSEAPQNKDIIIEQDNDMAYFQDPVLIPRHIYEENMDKFSCKAMYSALYVLMKYCNSNGVVIGKTTTDLADYYDYQDCRNIRRGLSKLEDIDIIDIDRSTRPHTYYINDYYFKGPGGFVVPEQYMISNIKNTKLKKLRLEWYNMLRNFHSPNNNSELDLRLDRLKGVINADSYNEVINLANELKNKFFDTVEIVANGVRKGHNKLKTKINSIALGVLESSHEQVESVTNHFKFNDIKYIFNQLGIRPTLQHFKQAYNLLDQYAEVCLIAVKDNCTADRFCSDHDTVGYLDWMFQMAADGAIQPQR